MMKVLVTSYLISLTLGLRVQPEEKKLVYDVGMNTGVDTENFLKMGYKVVAIEANPFFAKDEAKKEMNSEFLKNGDLKILNVGIKNDRASSNEPLDFWIPDVTDKLELTAEAMSGTASFTKHNACRLSGACHAIQVPTMQCSHLLEENGTPHYFKVDIEGQDIECVRNIMEKRCGPEQLPAYLSFENFALDTWPEYYGEGGKIKELMELMHKRGYTQWKRARQWVATYNISTGSGEDSSFGEDVLDLETTKAWKPTSDFKEKIGCDDECDPDKGLCKGYCDMHAKLDTSLAKC